ncbi:MAG: hypothetical protein JWR44_3634 [Hymenobacter sp.]|jgi:anti-anti-sigma regulatory factor|nr:hypothetical protein [Hymenobacter sp.]
MVLFHDALPGAYLLVLSPNTDATTQSEAGLAHHLDRACRSGQPTVWVDCRLLETVSSTVAWLLWACHHRLRRRQMALVLCHVSERAERVLRQAFRGPDLCLANGLGEVTN